MLACQADDNAFRVSIIIQTADQVLRQSTSSSSSLQAYVNEADMSGNTALAIASKYGNINSLRVLLEEGASPITSNRRRDTALHLASHRNHHAVTRLLLSTPVRSISGALIQRSAEAMVSDHYGDERFIDVHNQAGFSPLHLSVLAGNTETTRVLLEYGASLDSPVLRGMERFTFLSGGSTALHMAAALGNVDMCLLLLQGQWRQPTMDLRRIRNIQGLTPLNCALLAGHHALCRLLLEVRSPALPQISNNINTGVSNGRGNNNNDVSFDLAFPELRQRLLGVVHRTSLLYQLKGIITQWDQDGLTKQVSEGDLPENHQRMMNLSMIPEVSPENMETLRHLLMRDEATLAEIRSGLEIAFHGATMEQEEAEDREEEEQIHPSSGSGSGSPTLSFSVRHRLRRSTSGGSSTGTSRRSMMTMSDEMRSESFRRRWRERRREARRVAAAFSAIATHYQPQSPGRGGSSNVGGGGAMQAGGGDHNIIINNNDSAIGLPIAAAADTADTVVVNNNNIENDNSKKPSAAMTTMAPPSPPSQEQEQKLESKDCAICFEKYPSFYFVEISPCNHNLCFTCACKFSEKTPADFSLTCPFCRGPISSYKGTGESSPAAGLN